MYTVYSLLKEENTFMSFIIKTISVLYNFLWGDLIVIPLPGGGTLGLSLLVKKAARDKMSNRSRRRVRRDRSDSSAGKFYFPKEESFPCIFQLCPSGAT